jgi:hypothetical protein
VCVKFHYQTKLEPHSSVIASPATGFHHLVHRLSCGVLCVYTVGLRGFHHREDSALVSLCWLQRKPLTPLV